MKKINSLLAAAIVLLSGLLAYVYFERKQRVKEIHRYAMTMEKTAQSEQAANATATAEAQALRRSQIHYLSLYKLYAATERHRQYGLADRNVAIFYGVSQEFTPIEDVTEKLICPKPVKDPPNGFTFFGIRSTVLRRTGQKPLFYTMSYTGNHAFIRDKDWFDALLDLGSMPDAKQVMLPDTRAAGLMERAPRPHTRNGSFITPFSFNATDLNGDGIDDFAFGGRLFLSSPNGFNPIADTALDGREIVFTNGQIFSPNNDKIERWSLHDGALRREGRSALAQPVATNRPFTILPLNGAVTDKADAIIVSSSSLDFYSLDNGTVRVLSIPAATPHSIIIGARGDFDADGIDDLWLTESRWKNKDGVVVGRASLLSSRHFSLDAKSIEDLTAFTLYGSERYTDYDGIGTSLSPIAGDFDGDGRPDLSTPGHINLNEAGALYILLNRNMTGISKTVADNSVIRIAGKPVSNLAPPFVHYDADLGTGRNRIVITADADLCSGISGGAVYILDVAKLSGSSR